MAAESLHRIRELFERAVALSLEDRAAFLDTACGHDEGLRKELEGLLKAHEEASGLPGDSTAVVVFGGELQEDGDTADVVRSLRLPDLEPGTRIGPYKLQQEIGEGGFGTVWMAEQEEPVRRKVALKVIKLGMDTKEVIARFEAERQALAMMEHPNIAKVLDAGATDEGRPFFVMELVKGIPITDYSDMNQLSLRERLELFVDVCLAVQHAHHKGVIHRDIKPSNILVTLHDGKPVPKVIDFGVAKAMNARLTKKTFFTRFHQLIGTPVYMSPEQAEMSGLDVDTRSDIYSLGVLLYELLVGTTPLDPEELFHAGYEEMQRVIREREPPTPSMRLSTLDHEGITAIAQHRHVDAADLRRLLRGELDWIIMKSLEKDRTRRYETAVAFAEDVLRYLHNEPVEAGRPSKLYRLRKLLSRYRAAALVTIIVFTSLVLGLAAATYGLIRATDEAENARIAEAGERDQRLIAEGAVKAARQSESLARDEAQNAREAESREREAREQAEEAQENAERSAAEARSESKRANAVLMLVGNMFLEADPTTRKGRDYKVSEMLDDFARSYRWEELANEPSVEATLRFTLGQAYWGLSDYAAAERHWSRADELFRVGTGPDSSLSKSMLFYLSRLESAKGNYAEAERLIEKFLASGKPPPGEGKKVFFQAMAELSAVKLELNKLSEAEQVGREALEEARKELGKDHSVTLSMANSLSSLYITLERDEDAQDVLSGYVCEDSRLGDVDASQSFATVLGGGAGAVPLLKKLVEVRRRTLGEKDPKTLEAMICLSAAYLDQERFSDVQEILGAALEIEREIMGPVHQRTLKTQSILGSVCLELGKLADAEKLLKEAADLQTRTLPEGHPDTLSSMSQLAQVYLAQRRSEEAEELQNKVVELRGRKLGEDHADSLVAQNDLAMVYLGQGRYAEAEPILQKVLKADRVLWGDKHSRTIIVRVNLGHTLVALRRYEEAVTVLEESIKITREKLREDHAYTLGSMSDLITAYYGLDRDNDAEDLLEQLLAIFRQHREPQNGQPHKLHYGLASMSMQQGHFNVAEPLLREYLDGLRESHPEGHRSMPFIQWDLAFSLAKQGKLDDAEQLYLKAYPSLRDDPEAPQGSDEVVLKLLTELYEKTRHEQSASAFIAEEFPGAKDTATDPDLLVLLARLHRASGDLPGAVQALERAIRLGEEERDRPEWRAVLESYRKEAHPELLTYATIDACLGSEEVVVSEGAEWRFFRGTAEPSPGMGWTVPDFKDSAWETGRSGFGYADGDDRTVLEDMQESYTTVYIRKTFRLPDGASDVRLSVLADDGFVAYWNGKEIGRNNAGEQGVRLPFDAVADGDNPEPIVPVEIAIPPEVVAEGENCLAIQGLNRSLESSDLWLLPILQIASRPDLQRLESFGMLAAGDDAPARIAYFKARVLQRAGDQEQAVTELKELIARDASQPEPVLRLSESLRALGKAEAAESCLREPLSRGVRGRDLWERWFEVASVDLKHGAERLLATFPVDATGDEARLASEFRWALEGLQKENALRINVGGENYTSPEGVAWSKDRFFTSGWHYNDGPQGGTKAPFAGHILDTEDDALYQTERWFPGGARRAYRIPVPPGRYRVVLHFAEIYHKEAGKRIFGIRIEGEEVQSDFEPLQAGYATAHQKPHDTRAVDGFLDIEFVPGPAGAPKISAIEVLLLD